MAATKRAKGKGKNVSEPSRSTSASTADIKHAKGKGKKAPKPSKGRQQRTVVQNPTTEYWIGRVQMMKHKHNKI